MSETYGDIAYSSDYWLAAEEFLVGSCAAIASANADIDLAMFLSGNGTTASILSGDIDYTKDLTINLPKLTPLKNSFVVNDIEDQLRNLFIDLFRDYFSYDVFDVNVLGMAHLGSLNLVKRTLNKDGLSVLPDAGEESAIRYIYHAWKSANVQGRGLIFLRTYLQSAYPNKWSIEQQMQLKALSYASDGSLSDRSTTGDDSDKFLTSRVNIKLAVTSGLSLDASFIARIIGSILPARIVPSVAIAFTDQAAAQVMIGACGIGSITLICNSTTT